MEFQFTDRVLVCSDCRAEFIFTAGEQFFFYEKQFKNDPKRCKSCKSRRSGVSSSDQGAGPAIVSLSRTETRTLCSECGVETTVPFKPTQGRPVLCRQCYQGKIKVPAGIAAAAPIHRAPSAPTTGLGIASVTASPHTEILPAIEIPGMTATVPAQEALSTLTAISTNPSGSQISNESALAALSSMAAASPGSSVATFADLDSISKLRPGAEMELSLDILQHDQDTSGECFTLMETASA